MATCKSGVFPNPNVDITNLSGLSFITQVNGSLNIHNNPLLTSLQGLHNITSVQSLLIDLNPGLTNLSGLTLSSVPG